MKSKVPDGSAKPVVRAKRLVNCSKCKSPHFPPTGRACQKQVNIPNPDLSSTLANAEEQPPAGNPTLSPVRPDPATLAALETLAAQRQALAQGSPITESPVRLEPNTQEAEAHMIQNLLDRFGHGTQSATIPPHLAHASHTVPPVTHQPPNHPPGPSTQSVPIPHDSVVNDFIKWSTGILKQLLANQQFITARHDNLAEQVRKNACELHQMYLLLTIMFLSVSRNNGRKSLIPVWALHTNSNERRLTTPQGRPAYSSTRIRGSTTV